MKETLLGVGTGGTLELAPTVAARAKHEIATGLYRFPVLRLRRQKAPGNLDDS